MASRNYTVQQVKMDLAHRFERYKTHDATLASLQEIQAARRSGAGRRALLQKLEGMIAAKRQLEVDVENLEARFKMVEVAQTAAPFNLDDSQLGRVKDLLAEVRTRLNVAERLVNTEMDIDGEIPLGAPQAENIVDQVTEYFSTTGRGESRRSTGRRCPLSKAGGGQGRQSSCRLLPKWCARLGATGFASAVGRTTGRAGRHT